MAGRPDESEHLGARQYHDAIGSGADGGEISWRQVPISPLHRKSSTDLSFELAVSEQVVRRAARCAARRRLVLSILTTDALDIPTSQLAWLI